MTKFKVFVTALISITCLTVAILAGVSNGAFNNLNFVRAQQSYSCNDIVFSETVANPSSRKDISDISTIAYTTIDASMTGWTNANYGTKGTTAIKIGGSDSGKHAGHVDLRLNNSTTDKVMIYAAGWSKDPAENLKLKVNNTDYQTVSATSGSYEYNLYIFELASATDSLTFYNNQDSTGKGRIVISKIVFRLYNGGGDISSSSSTSSSSSSEPIQNVVTILPSDGTAVENSDYSIEKQGVTISVNASTLTDTQMRIYKGKTLTVSSSHYISSIQFTCTASGSEKYGPGGFSITAGSYDYEETLGIWAGNSKSIVFTASLNQVRVTQIVVLYN